MLSYLHAFHAGNHADVLKHVTLLAILSQLAAKDKPLRYIETHAGAGGYYLRSPAARRNHEYRDGIGRLWGSADAPPVVGRWLALVRRYNGGEGELERYPGSPWLAREALRRDDSMYLFEMHPAEHRRLLHDLGGRAVHVLREDGLARCIGLVPPPERRSCMLIDPSYETADEHVRVLDALAKAHQRFSTGVFAVWYPIIERRWVQRFERAARALAVASLALYELSIAPPAANRGLMGSGMLVVNPPWTLRDEMESALPWLARKLGRDGRGAYRIAE